MKLMKLMKIGDVKLEHLLILVAALFLIYFFLNIKETFEQFKTKEESEKAINEAYHKYIWGTPNYIK